MELLENSFCSFSIINNKSKINEHDIFISLNHLGQKLCEIDILKAFFLKKMSSKNNPTLISESWNIIIKKSSLAKQKSKFDIDALLVRYISQYKRGVVKKDIIPFYNLKFEEINSSKLVYTNLDSYINDEVEKIKDFLVCFIDSIIFEEENDSLSTTNEKYVNTICSFLLNNKHIYKPLIPLIIHYNKHCLKNGADCIKKFMEFSIFVLYLIFKNKNNKNFSNESSVKFIAGNRFKNKVEEYFASYYDSSKICGVKDLYFIFGINDNNKNEILNDDSTWKQLAHFLTNFIFKSNQKITKNFKILLEWFSLAQDEPFFKFKNRMTCEHFIQDIYKLDKKRILETKNINFIENEIDKNMNIDIKNYFEKNKLNGQSKIEKIKSSKLEKEKLMNGFIKIKKEHYRVSQNKYSVLYSEYVNGK